MPTVRWMQPLPTFRCARLVADAENNSILVSSVLWISSPALSILLPSTHVLKCTLTQAHTCSHTFTPHACTTPPHTFTHGHTLTHIHTCSHLHTQSHRNTHSHRHTQTHTSSHMHTHAHTHSHMLRYAHTHTCTHTHLTHIHTCSHNPTHAHTCSYTHAHMLTRTYTHAHPHTCTRMHSLNDFINIPVLECFSLYVRLVFLKGWFAALPSGHGLWKCLHPRLSQAQAPWSKVHVAGWGRRGGFTDGAASSELSLF